MYGIKRLSDKGFERFSIVQLDYLTNDEVLDISMIEVFLKVQLCS